MSDSAVCNCLVCHQKNVKSIRRLAKKHLSGTKCQTFELLVDVQMKDILKPCNREQYFTGNKERKKEHFLKSYIRKMLIITLISHHQPSSTYR